MYLTSQCKCQVPGYPFAKSQLNGDKKEHPPSTLNFHGPSSSQHCAVKVCIAKTENDQLIPRQTRTASTMHSMTWFHLTTMSTLPFKQIPIFKATQPPTTST
jgi:hypothetical protein